VKLIDFGVAKAAGLTKETQTGSLRGKLAYMPPEQAYGRPVDRRADIYALGIVLWEMLTMRRLFQADNDLALLEHVRKPVIVPPSQIVPGIPPALDHAVMAALAPDAANRPASADELRSMLAAAVPAALGKSARDVATMIAAILPDQIADARRRLSEVLGTHLPQESSPVVDANVHEALATMTIENPEATILFDDERAASPPPFVQPSLQPPAPMPAKKSAFASAAMPFVLITVVASAVIVTGLAVIKARTSPAAAMPTAVSSETTAAASIAPPTSVVAPSAAPPASTPEPSASDVAPTASAPPAASVASRPRTKTTPRGGKPATAATTAAPATASSVEMHNGVPIFNHGL
jgi:serine/threonine-protein kinase